MGTNLGEQVFCGDSCSEFAIAGFIFYATFLGYMAESMRQLPKWGIPIAVSVVPLAFLPYIIPNLQDRSKMAFIVVKFVSVIIGSLIIWANRYTEWTSQKGKFWSMNICLGVTVVIVSVQDAVDGNFINAISGLLLIIAQPCSFEDMKIEGEAKDMMWTAKNNPIVQQGYNWAYTLWNLSFIVSSFSDDVGGIRFAASLVAVMMYFGAWVPGMWLQLRFFSVYLHILLVLILGEKPFAYMMPMKMDSISDDGQLAFNIASLIFSLTAVILRYALPTKYEEVEAVKEVIDVGDVAQQKELAQDKP